MAKKSETLDLVIRVKGAANESIKRINQRLANMRKRIFNLKTAVAGLGIGLVSKDFINTAASFEKFETSLTTITGSGEKAKKAMDWITEFTAKTPYELDQVTDAFVKLSAYGFDATEHLGILGDTAASMGKDLNMAVEAFADAATGEFERLKEFGIRAKTEGDNVTFSWVENGQQMQKTMQKTQDAISKGLSEIWSGRFSGGMDKFASTWSGMWSNLKDQFTLFQKSVMESGLFNYLKNMLSLVLQRINKLRKEGKLDEWAKQISDGVIRAFETMAMGIAGFLDFAKPMLGKIKEGITSIWDWFTGLPAWVQKAGLVLAIFGGLSSKILFGFFAITDARIKGLKKQFKEFSELGGKGGLADMIEAQKDAKEKNIVTKKISPRTQVDEDAANKDLSETQKRLQTFFAKLRSIQQDEAAKSKGISDGDNLSSPGKIVSVSDVARQKSILAKMTADNALYFKQLEQLFEDGKKTVDEYYSEQILRANALFEEKKKLLELERTSAKEADDKKAIEDSLYALEKAHQVELLDLARQRRDAEKDLAQQKLRAQQILGDIDIRTSDKKVGFGLDSVFSEEQADMSQRHAEELASLEQLVNDKMAREMGYIDELALLKDVAKQHELEQEQLLADQQTQLMQARLSLAQEVAGGIAQAFTAMYELSGKKTKEFFYIAKAASIAQATMKMSEAIVGALGSPPYSVGAIAQSVLVGIMAAAQIAKITAQQLAGGGSVLGRSPSDTADNVPIWATAGEYMHPVKTVRHYGLGVMEAIKNRMVPKEIFSGFRLPSFSMPQPSFAMAAGGPVGRMAEQGSTRDAGRDEDRINVFNILDDSMFEQYAASAKGQRSYLNIISQNRYAIKQMLMAEG